jgi:hypothetical protein
MRTAFQHALASFNTTVSPSLILLTLPAWDVVYWVVAKESYWDESLRKICCAAVRRMAVHKKKTHDVLYNHTTARLPQALI